MTLVFTCPDDVHDIFGNLSFGVNTLKDCRAANVPEGLSIRYVLPQEDGSWLAYGSMFHRDGDKQRWRLMRGRTCDGMHFENFTTVHHEPAGDWLGCSDMAYNAKTNTLLFFTWKRYEGSLFGLHIFASNDGLTWKPVSEKPAYFDHDSFGTLWDARTDEYVVYQATYQKYDRKPFKDNAGLEFRRVLTLRTSKDLIHWTPDDAVSRLGHLLDPRLLITPDEHDTPELEFYRLYVFMYHDRYVGMMLNYCPWPVELSRGAHGPHLNGEWWLSRDGRAWTRPWRDIHGSGAAPGIIHCPPMTIHGQHLWAMGSRAYGIPENRLFWAGSMASSAFTTDGFVPEGRPITLNAAIGFQADPARGMQNQGYIMVEVLDEQKRTIEGYEKERCILWRADGPREPLTWDGTNSGPLNGRSIRLRIHLRDARVYAVNG